MKYTYFVGGIRIASEIYFNELKISTGLPHALLKYGDVPENLKTNFVDFPFLQINRSQYLLKLPGIGRYLVENGSQITIMPEQGADIRIVNNQILTSPFAALSYQRQMIPFHGGMFLLNGYAYLISGLSGAGKSTLLAGLNKKGYTVIADDISNIELIEGKLVAYPTFPRIMLWEDTCSALDISLRKEDQLRQDIKKYLSPISAEAFDQTFPLKHIYILKESINAAEKIEVSGMVKMKELKENLFHPYLIAAIGLQKEYGVKLFDMASHITMSIFGVERTTSIAEFIDAFEDQLKNAE